MKPVRHCKWALLLYTPKNKRSTWACILVEGWHGQSTSNQKKPCQSKSETNALATREKINIINRKQTPPVQSRTLTNMDLRNSAMGDSLQFQHRHFPALPIQDSPIHSERTLVHKRSQDPWRSTNEHSAQWNKKVECQALKQIRKPH
jgi:hypothetical protein